MITQISASAGSGKTYSLTRLFLNLLSEAEEESPVSACALPRPDRVHSLSEILAATFTNKAAAEMKGRVIALLKKEALEERRLSAQATDSATPGFAEIWVERILRHYSHLNIRTIDSLLTSLTRLSSLELALPPDFKPSFDPSEFFTPVYDALMEDLSAVGQLANAPTGRNSPQAHTANEKGFTGLCNEDYADAPARRGRSEERYPPHEAIPDLPLFYSADPAALRADLTEACRTLVFFGDCRGFTPKMRLHDQVLELVTLLLTGKSLPRMEIPAILNACLTRRNKLITAATSLNHLLVEERLHANALFIKTLASCIKLSGHTPPPQGVFARKNSLDACLNAFSRGKASSRAELAFTEFSNAVKGYADTFPLFKHALQLAPLVGLALEIHSRMQAERCNSKLLPSISIPFLAGRALSGEYGVSDALCRLGTRLSRLLLDEFQDTSREQWAAILPLVEESLSTGGALTYVGDVKQAIYGWRGGDTRLFNGVLQEPSLLAMRPQVKRLFLPFNWRSHPLIIAHNNVFFSLLQDRVIQENVMNAMLPEHTPAEYRAEAASELGRAFAQVEQKVPEEKDWENDPLSGHAGVTLYIAEADSIGTVRNMVHDRMRSLFLNELLPAWRYGDIAVLTPSGDEGALAAQWISDWGIPVVTENSFLLNAHPLVGKLISFLSFLDYPPDDEAFWETISDPDLFWPDSGLYAAALMDWLSRTALDKTKKRPPLYRLFSESFPEFWNSRMAPFHAGAGFMSAYDLMREIITRSQLFERMPDQSSFFLRLLEIAHLAETRGCSCLSAFLAFWRIRRDKERLPLPESMNAVRIMTVHKAKGLEFPVVVLPFLHHSKSRKADLANFHCDGLDLITRADKELQNSYYPAKSADETEHLNLLYVAWTRPVYSLYAFITRPKKSSTSLQRALAVLLKAYEQRTGMTLCRREYLREETADDEKGETYDPPARRPPQPADNEAPAMTNTRRGDGPGRISDGATGKERLMGWLPRLKIYRSRLDDARFTPDRRGMLIHLCLENLFLPLTNSPESLTLAVTRSVRRAMRLFPLLLDDPECAAMDMQNCLSWFVSLPEAPLWLTHGRREQSIIDTDGSMRRVDLLVDEAFFEKQAYAPSASGVSALPFPYRESFPSPDPKSPPEEIRQGPCLLALDYKTGLSFTQAIKEDHRRQVRQYMRLVAEARNRPVRGTLVYLDERRLEKVLL
ncbi:MAG: UvrD-helicase domain-containing protein [Desulfovibrio sp.]|jgi:superfamily I DNA/RNA helicase|nr:UvrD-helicase domain-containing protein [Desulfovibrio sp.]